MTGGRLRSTPHRVRPPERDRYSFPLFLDPAFDAEIAPLPGCEPTERARREAAPDGGTAERGRPAGTYGDYLLDRVSRVFPELFEQVTAAGRGRPQRCSRTLDSRQRSTVPASTVAQRPRVAQCPSVPHTRGSSAASAAVTACASSRCRPPVAHHVLATDPDIGDVAATGGVHDGRHRIEHGLQMRAVQVDRHDVGQPCRPRATQSGPPCPPHGHRRSWPCAAPGAPARPSGRRSRPCAATR